MGNEEEKRKHELALQQERNAGDLAIAKERTNQAKEAERLA